MTNTIKIDNKKLLDELKRITNLIEGKIYYNIESNVKLQVIGNKLYIIATNGLIWFNSTLEIENFSGSSFQVAVYFKKFYNLIREYKIDDTFISFLDNNKINITNKNNKILLLGMDAAAFPTIDEKNYKLNYELNYNNETIRSIKKSKSNISNDVLKPSLKYYQIENIDNDLYINATTGRTLSHEKLNGTIHEKNNLLIDPMIFDMLVCNFKKNDTGIIKIYTDIENEYIKMVLNDITIYSKVVDQKYPNIHNIIPKEYAKEFTVNTKELKKAIKQISPMIKEVKTKRIFFTVQNKELYVVSVNEEIGQSQVLLSDYVDLPDFQIAFSPIYINAILKNTVESETTFLLSEGIKPSLINNIIIMPMDSEGDLIELLNFDIVINSHIEPIQAIESTIEPLERVQVFNIKSLKLINKPIENINLNSNYIKNPFIKEKIFNDRQIKNSYYFRHFRTA